MIKNRFYTEIFFFRRTISFGCMKWTLSRVITKKNPASVYFVRVINCLPELSHFSNTFCAVASSYTCHSAPAEGMQPKKGVGWRKDEAESSQQENETDGLWEMTLPPCCFVLAATDHMRISSQEIGVGDPMMKKKVWSRTEWNYKFTTLKHDADFFLLVILITFPLRHFRMYFKTQLLYFSK